MITQQRIDQLSGVALSAGPDTYLLVQESIRIAVVEATEASIRICEGMSSSQNNPFDCANAIRQRLGASVTN